MSLPGSDHKEPNGQPVLSVSQLTQQIKGLVEESFPDVWVGGEISNFSRPQSGHCYLTLKDQRAQIRAVIWRGVAARLKFDPDDGLEVVCRGHLDVYAPRGSYQLVIDKIMPRGMGALELALRQLHERLANEGLFDEEHKKPLPRFPRRIAVVTSPTGAAIRDFLEVLRRRWRDVNVLIVPVRVQGKGAAEEIAAAIRQVNALSTDVDVMVGTRGGGSLEDLWAFNEEPVVRAIFDSKIPFVSAVGHEIDVTLSDLVADVRALTPSEAAELVVPSLDEFITRIDTQKGRLITALRRRAETARSRLAAITSHRIFSRPFEIVQQPAQRLDGLLMRSRLAIRNRINEATSRLKSHQSHLTALNPASVLRRGYSITTRRKDDQLIRSPSDIQPGDRLMTQLAGGVVESEVVDD